MGVKLGDSKIFYAHYLNESKFSQASSGLTKKKKKKKKKEKEKEKEKGRLASLSLVI